MEKRERGPHWDRKHAFCTTNAVEERALALGAAYIHWNPGFVWYKMSDSEESHLTSLSIHFHPPPR